MPDELIETGGYPEIYADDLADAQLLTGGNVRLVLFSWRKIEGIYRKCIAGMVVRPLATMPAQHEVLHSAERARALTPPGAGGVRH